MIREVAITDGNKLTTVYGLFVLHVQEIHCQEIIIIFPGNNL